MFVVREWATEKLIKRERISLSKQMPTNWGLSVDKWEEPEQLTTMTMPQQLNVSCCYSTKGAYPENNIP